ncbi:hypothetical protein INR49_004719 [Caranx melampygus]|nr:hypothetical protein INR49_004719 [Caranx melampygus]
MPRCVRPPARPFGSNHRAKALNETKRATEATTRFLFDSLVEQNKTRLRLPVLRPTSPQHQQSDGACDVTSWAELSIRVLSATPFSPDNPKDECKGMQHLLPPPPSSTSLGNVTQKNSTSQ